MRTTLTLDADVAAEIERVRRARQLSLKAIVNEALRRGIRDIESPREADRRPYRTPTMPLGQCLFGDLDDIETVLELAEGDDHS